MNNVSSEQIVEVKMGQTGTGLLIEHDGHINSDSNVISQIKEDINNNHRFVIPEHFVVSAVFQKYGVKNANGRIYPETLLKREVNKYIENKVVNHCALGSLDHPSCQLSDTKILTTEGWKQIPDVKIGDKVLTVSKDKRVEIKPVIRKIEEPYKGIMYNIKGDFIDITVTPNHKFPILDENGEWKGLFTAEELELVENAYLFRMNTNPQNIYDMEGDMEHMMLPLSETIITKVEKDEMVYCIEVENHTFYTMCHDGNHLWSGNSSCLSGHDIAHNILDLRWDNKTLVGEMELHLSPGYIKYGVCSTSGDLVANMLLSNYLIGVSSRGVGSVEQKMGNYIVGDDFELICWDVVIEPSTPGAYIKNSSEELGQFTESDKTKSRITSLNEKINKINHILFE